MEHVNHIHTTQKCRKSIFGIRTKLKFFKWLVNFIQIFNLYNICFSALVWLKHFPKFVYFIFIFYLFNLYKVHTSQTWMSFSNSIVKLSKHHKIAISIIYHLKVFQIYSSVYTFSCSNISLLWLLSMGTYNFERFSFAQKASEAYNFVWLLRIQHQCW